VPHSRRYLLYNVCGWLVPLVQQWMAGTTSMLMLGNGLLVTACWGDYAGSSGTSLQLRPGRSLIFCEHFLLTVVHVLLAWQLYSMLGR